MKYKGYNEKVTTMKGHVMSQNQKDNKNLLLEWETTFAALCVVAELHRNIYPH